MDDELVLMDFQRRHERILKSIDDLKEDCETLIAWLRPCCELLEEQKLLNCLPADLQRWWQRQKDLDKPVQKRKRSSGPSSKKRGKREMKSTMETGTSHGGLPLSQFQRGAYGGGHGNPND